MIRVGFGIEFLSWKLGKSLEPLAKPCSKVKGFNRFKLCKNSLEIHEQSSTRDIGYESNSWVRPSMSGVYQTIGLWWLILDRLPPSYGLHQIFFWLDCAFLHLNFRVWNFRWKGISFKLKNFQVQKKRDLKQSVSVTNAGTVAQSDSLGTFDKMHSDQFYVWVMLDSWSIQSH